ncbi:MAG: hypothetical protein NZ908_02610, partial [Candidatus Micrarchaeota archaeon]|nr:hypothetical protein [Candidatus Micrarchaeota archaeon]
KHGDLDRIQNYGRITVSEVARRMKNAIFSRSDHHHAGSDEIHDVVDSDSSDTDADAGGGE